MLVTKRLEHAFGMDWGNLGYYDYNARFYNPAIGRFSSIDPHAESYMPINPYVYVANNPLKYIDPTGMDGIVTGSGTENDPYVIKARYFYLRGELTEKEAESLTAAAQSYNDKGVITFKNENKTKTYVRYDLQVEGFDNTVDFTDAFNDTFIGTIDGEKVYYGNIVNAKAAGEQVGEAHYRTVSLNPRRISELLEGGFSNPALTISTFIHEIGHNLGLYHRESKSDKTPVRSTNVMKQISGRPGGVFNDGTNTFTTDLPSVDAASAKILIENINKPRFISPINKVPMGRLVTTSNN